MFAGAQTVARRPASAEPAACRQNRGMPSKPAPAAASAKSKYHRLSTKTKTGIVNSRNAAEEWTWRQKFLHGLPTEVSTEAAFWKLLETLSRVWKPTDMVAMAVETEMSTCFAGLKVAADKYIRCQGAPRPRKRTRAEEPQEAKGKDGEDKTQGLKAADPVEDPDAKPKTKASRARRSGHIPAQETGNATREAKRGCHLREQKMSEVLGAALLQSHQAASSAGLCAEPKGPPARNTSQAKLTQHKLAMLPERYRSGYELAVNDLGRREICLPAGATSKDRAKKWHSYIHSSHLIKITCRELEQDIPADLLLPGGASANETATWLLALMDRKELLLPGYPEVRKLPDGYRRGEVSPDQCNCFISALWHILILLVLVFVPVLVYMYVYIYTHILVY